ncbi:MAG TPA: hypothetical protein VGR64_00800, partial [Terracidiphilus sp.]|nr:hypothetical protein [Terracidiphilus sp.]
MTRRSPLALFAVVSFLVALPLVRSARAQSSSTDSSSAFRTSERCINCHGTLKAADGKDASIGLDWSASIMANAARDPYWQGSVRREVLDHPEASATIQNECATCHMPLAHLQDKAQHHFSAVFALLPLRAGDPHTAAAAEGVTCTVCHQIQPDGLGTSATANGNFAVAPLSTTPRPVFGPYDAPDRIDKVHILAAGYAAVQSETIQQAALCASCHTLYTTAYGPGGKPIGRLPEQMTFLEWQHSSFSASQTCQQCHMPAVQGATNVSSIMGQPRTGVRRHTFVGANFFMLAVLNANRDALAVTASPDRLAAAAASTTAYLQSHAAQLTVSPAQLAGGTLSFSVQV